MFQNYASCWQACINFCVTQATEAERVMRAEIEKRRVAEDDALKVVILFENCYSL